MSIGEQFSLPSTLLPAPLKPEPPLMSFFSLNVSSSNGSSKPLENNVPTTENKEVNVTHLKNELVSSIERLKKMTTKAEYYKQEKQKRDVIIQELQNTNAKLSKQIEQMQKNKKTTNNSNPFIQKLSPSRSNSFNTISNSQLKYKNEIQKLKEQHRINLDQQKKQMKRQHSKSSSCDKSQISKLNDDLISLQQDKLNLVNRLQQSQTSNYQSFQKLNSQLVQLRFKFTQSLYQLQQQRTLVQKQKKAWTSTQANLRRQIQQLIQLNQDIQKRFQQQLHIDCEQKLKTMEVNFEKQMKEVCSKHKEQVDIFLNEKNDLLLQVKDLMANNMNLQQTLMKEKEQKRIIKEQLITAMQGFQKEFTNIKKSCENNNQNIEQEEGAVLDKIEEKNPKVKKAVDVEKEIALQNVIDNISDVLKVKEQNIQTLKLKICSLETKIVELQKSILDQKNSFSVRQSDYVTKIKQTQQGIQHAFLQYENAANQTMNNKIKLLKQNYNQKILTLKNQNELLKSCLKETPNMLSHEFQIKNKDKIIDEINKKVVTMIENDKVNKNKIEEYEKMVMMLQEKIESQSLQRQWTMEEKMIQQQKKRDKLKKVILRQDYLKTPVKVKKQQNSEGISSCRSDFVEQVTQQESIKLQTPVEPQPNPNFVKKPALPYVTSQTQTTSPLIVTTFQQTEPQQQQSNQSTSSIIDNLKDQLLQKQNQIQKQLKDISQLLLQLQTLQRQFQSFSSQNQKQKNQLSRQNSQHVQRLKQSHFVIIGLESKVQVLVKQNLNLRTDIETSKNNQQKIIQLQSQKQYLQTDLFSKTTSLKNLQTNNQQLKLILTQTQTKLSEAMITISNNKSNQQTVISQKELILALQGELACKSTSLQQIQSNKFTLSHNFNERLHHLQTQLKTTTQFKNQLSEQLKNKLLQAQSLKQIVEKNNKKFIQQNKQMVQMIHNLEDKLKKQQEKNINNTNNKTSQLEMLMSQINHLKSFIDVKDQKHCEQINSLNSKHRSDIDKYCLKITEQQKSIEKITQQHFKIKGHYETAIGKEKKFREKIKFVLNGIRVVEEGIMQDLTSSLIKENNQEEQELNLSKLSQQFENMVEKSAGVKQEGQTTLKREVLAKSNETQKTKNYNGIVSIFDNIEISGKLPLTTPPQRPKQK